jgi:ppGpp synthetase/RelA/SpoT-type nucleotidyltranferase
MRRRSSDAKVCVVPLSDQEIEIAVARYRREADRYSKLVGLVANLCRELIADNAIPATVQSRVKDADRLRGKLRKYRDDYESVDEVFANLKDLAGVRVATYVESDRERVANEVVRRFTAPGGGDVQAIVKDSADTFYRATHCQVALTDDDLGPGYQNLQEDSCEVQICSLLAHVWNELEHDLEYKPLSGDLSDGEQRALEALGNLTRAGDHTIVNLLEATDTRLATNQGEFKDQWDFVARARRFFPEARDFGAHSGQLFNELLAEGLDNPHKIEETLLPDGAVAHAYELMDEFQRYLAGDDVVRRIEPESSDPLLMLFLERFGDRVLERHPGGRGMGRPPRIASVARRFNEMSRRSEDNTEAADASAEAAAALRGGT